MRRIYYWSLTTSIGVAALALPIAVSAASAPTSADRARIALLVYQSQSARQADLRRGDTLTRGLRLTADRAEKIASATRAELARVRAEGARAKKGVEALEQQLEAQEQKLADIAQKYTAELAKRDEEYARERSVLISTGERLLTTMDGRRVLDLYNAGGEANWREAKAVLDESRKVRRALDTRDAAVMYAQARAKGLENTPSVIAVYEELLRDDPSQANDWFFISILYRESGQNGKALESAKRAASLATGDSAKIRVLIEVARAHRASGDIQSALTALREAEKAARAGVAKNPRSTARSRILADVLTQSGSNHLELGDGRSAKDAYREAIRLYEDLLPRTKLWPMKEMYLGALLGLAHALWNEENVAEASPQIQKAHSFATEALKLHPDVTEAREKVALTSAWVGDLFVSQWKYESARHMYEKAASTYAVLTAEDPDLVWYDPNVEYLSRAVGSAEIELNRAQSALGHLERSEKISRKYPSASYQIALQSGLRRQAVALAAMGRKQEAERQWNEALRIGEPLLKHKAIGPGLWARVEQSSVLLDLANESLGSRNFARGLELIAAVDPLYQSLRLKLPVAARALRMTAARLHAELTFASGDSARSTEIYDAALIESEPFARDPAARIDLRFGMADLLLSSSKQRLALNDRPTAIARLRLAHELLREVASECDSAEVHRKYAEASWLKAENDVDQVSWALVSDQFQRLKEKAYLNENAERLFARARAKTIIK